MHWAIRKTKLESSAASVWFIPSPLENTVTGSPKRVNTSPRVYHATAHSAPTAQMDAMTMQKTSAILARI